MIATILPEPVTLRDRTVGRTVTVRKTGTTEKDLVYAWQVSRSSWAPKCSTLLSFHLCTVFNISFQLFCRSRPLNENRTVPWPLLTHPFHMAPALSHEYYGALYARRIDHRGVLHKGSFSKDMKEKLSKQAYFHLIGINNKRKFENITNLLSCERSERCVLTWQERKVF